VFSQCAGTCAEAAIDAQAFSSDSVSSDSELAPSSSRNPSIAKNSSNVGAKLDAAKDTFFSDGVADMERVDHIEVVCTLLMLDASDNVDVFEVVCNLSCKSEVISSCFTAICASSSSWRNAHVGRAIAPGIVCELGDKPTFITLARWSRSPSVHLSAGDVIIAKQDASWRQATLCLDNVNP
jgi:hypothetical protein